ncbi:MAG: DeoR/GlpR family DNA-binding transcription regulator [Chloroflexi bacterium OHK40]
MGKAEARSAFIVQELTRHGAVTVEALAAQLAVDSSTIRRDLERLERQRILRRVHGGAVYADSLTYAHDLTFQGNMGKRVAEKTRIAAAAASLIAPGDTIALSPGSTTTFLARAIRQQPIRPLTVVTNAVNIAVELNAIPELTLVLTGGMQLPDFFALVGPIAEQTLGDLYTNLAFVGMHGVSAEHGLTGPNQLEALTFRATMRRSRRTIVLADSSKLGQVALYRIAPIEAAQHLITDAPDDHPELRAIAERGITIQSV